MRADVWEKNYMDVSGNVHPIQEKRFVWQFRGAVTLLVLTELPFLWPLFHMYFGSSCVF